MPVNQDTGFKAPLIEKRQRNSFEYPLKVLLYSHDSVGLGHLRRNLAIARKISVTFPNARIQILTGSPCDRQFKLPKRTDLIKIPSIFKDDSGRYVTNSFSGSLEDTFKFRSRMILQSFKLFGPDLIIVDHQLTGLRGEALEMLRKAKKKGVQIIFGLRDIKDSPEIVRRSWNTDEGRWALNECYDRICVYGMQSVFDPCNAYAPFLDKVKQIDFTGYIISGLKSNLKRRLPGKRKKVLVTFGGGGDGAQRAERYLEALTTAPTHWESHVITGPLMTADARRHIRALAKKIEPIGSVRVYRFHRHIPELLNQVDAVVSMAGYNSCVEILQSGLPAVLLPRSHPRKEQLIRATRFAELGWATVIPDADPDPRQLFAAVESALDSQRIKRPEVNLNGLNNLCHIIVDQLHSAGLVENVPQSAQSICRVS